MGRDAIPPGSISESPCDRCRAGAILTRPSAPGRSRAGPVLPARQESRSVVRLRRRPFRSPVAPTSATPRFGLPGRRILVHQHDRDTIDRMDAKQVWRAALGELQVSLSPANFETWLRDTQLIDVDEQRFRIAVPNGFAKDW